MNIVLQRALSASLRGCASIRAKQLQTNFIKPFPLTNFIASNWCHQIMSAIKPKVVFVLGAPGSGKGTQCAKIIDEFGYVHLSAGDLLRAERNRPGSEFGEMIEDYIKSARIIPVAITCSLLEKAMNEQIEKDATKNKFLIDGFPRNQDNLDGWIKQMQDKVDLQFVLFFECPDSICIDRCLNRNIGRVDDNMDSLKKRFEIFHHDSMPIVDYYEKQYLVRRVDSEPPSDLVFEDVRKAFTDYNAK